MNYKEQHEKKVNKYILMTETESKPLEISKILMLYVEG